MKIAVCHPGHKIIQAESSRKRWLHNKLTVLGAEAHFGASTKANLHSQATRDPHTQTISPFLEPRLRDTTTPIR